MKIFFFSFIFLITLSCANDDKIVLEPVTEELEIDATLRTLSIENGEFVKNDPSQRARIIIEENDEADGALLETENVYVTYIHRSSPRSLQTSESK